MNQKTAFGRSFLRSPDIHCHEVMAAVGYRIEYDGQAGRYEVKPEKNWFPGIVIVTVLVLISICFWPGDMQKFRSFLIPGEDAVTVQAFRNMTDDLRSGATLGEAVEAFCRFVIHEQ